MVDALRVDKPLTGNESVGKIRAQTEALIHQNNVSDPTRVPKTKDQTVYTDKQGQHQPNLDSNFEKFMQAIKNMPTLSETYRELFFSKFGNLVNSGLDANFTKEVSQYMQLLQMSEKDLLKFLTNQKESGVKFTGPFFELLRQLINGNSSVEFKGNALEFLRRYDSMTSGNHILKNMITNLKNIALNMPYSKGSELNTMISSLVTQHSNGENTQNLQILKNQILPFLANYVGTTKDFGLARDIMGVLTLNIARYETGNKEEFIKAFRSLMSFSEMTKGLPGVDASSLETKLLLGKIQSENASLIDKFVSIIAKGMGGAAGTQSKAGFENILTSMLLNESVYMPLLHLTIPADINGRQFFSEIWIDPDDSSDKATGGDEKAVKLFVKFDIKDLGFFEMVILHRGGKIDMELYYPQDFEVKEKDITQGLSEIMARNNLHFKSLFLTKVKEPKSISEVFPKLQERRNAINVTV